MSFKDVKNEADKIQEESESKLNDSTDFDEVTSKPPKWDLQTTRSHPGCEVDNEESSGSMTRSSTSDDDEEEEEDYDVNSNPETPNNGGSTIQHSIGRDEAKRIGKRKASCEIAAEIRALRLIREDALEVMKKRLQLSQQRRQKKEEWDRQKNELLHLNTLLQKDHLSPEEQNMKCSLISKCYGI